MRMSLIRVVSLLIVAIFLAACGSGAKPELQLSEINELLSKKYPMSKEQELSVTAFTDAGKKLLQEGKSAQASEKLAEALKILYSSRDMFVLSHSE